MTVSFWERICQERGELAYHFGTRRAQAPTKTLAWIRPKLAQAGITRIADITGLDWVGIPVYQAIRPNSRNVSVSLGKGLTRAQAKVSALMESIEGFHAERLQLPVTRETVRSMRSHLEYDPYALPAIRAMTDTLVRDPTYDPFAPPVGEPFLLQDDTRLDWVPATDLWTGKSTFVPKQLCELDFSVSERAHVQFFRATSNGLASGNTVAEAVLHSLCEVIERDSSWRTRDNTDRQVAQASVTSRLAQDMIERFARAGMHTEIIDASGPTGLPCFEAFLDHPEALTRYHGLGCSPSRTTALLRALTEAAQSRVGHIAGSRDDLPRRTYRDTKPHAYGMGGKPQVENSRDFRSAPTLPDSGPAALLREIVRRVRCVTGMSPMAIDLSRPDFDVPVVFVVAPGLRLHLPRRR